MIVREYHPLRMTEDSEFRKLLYLMCPGYSLPSRKTVSYSLIPQLEASAVCLTTDGWTSIENEGFTAVTAHFIDNDTKLISKLLECIIYNERHTAENLCSFLKGVIHEWELSNKITAVVSDNATNITAAVRLVDWRHVPCFTHTINLIVQSSLKENGSIKSIIDKIKSIVEFFKRRTLLDPRYKKFGFPDKDQDNQAYISLTKTVSSIKVSNIDTECPDAQNITQNTTNTTKNATSSKYENLLWEEFDQEVKRKTPASSENRMAAGIIETDSYLREPVIARTEDPFSWWENKNNQYPRLYQLVLSRLCAL
nr:unnamed protein product [Callosobruchus analis]